jgi:hypothetical protein
VRRGWGGDGSPAARSRPPAVARVRSFSILNPGDNWFWNPTAPYLNASSIFQQFAAKHDAGATLIFNVPPNSTGVVPQPFVDALTTFAAAREATEASAAARLAAPVTAPCSGLSVVVPVAPGASFDYLVSEEGLAVAGQVIGGYSVEVQMTAGGPWSLLPVRGVTVGARVVDVLPQPVTGAVALRWNCTVDLAPPPAVQLVNGAGECMGIPDGQAFPCWHDANFQLCQLVAANCSAGASSVWFAELGGGTWWSGVPGPGQPAINVDCNMCDVGRHAKVIDCGPGCLTPLKLVGDRVQVRAPPPSPPPRVRARGAVGGHRQPRPLGMASFRLAAVPHRLAALPHALAMRRVSLIPLRR